MSTGNVKLCYIVIDSFIVSMKSEDTYADLADAEIRFDRINYKVERPLLIKKNKKVIGLTKDELGGKIMNESAMLRWKMYGYLIDDHCVD